MNDATSEKSLTAKKYLFAFPRVMAALVLGTVGFSIFFLYTLAYNVNSVAVGFAVGLGYFSIAASQFLLGWLSDGKYTRWGRRKPYIFIFCPLTAISFIFVMLPHLILVNPDETALFIWLIIWDVIFEFSYGFTTVYQAWMPEQFTMDERPAVSQVQNVFNIIGQGVMLLFTFLVLTSAKDKIVANPNEIPADFLTIVYIFAILLIVIIYLGAILMPVEPYYEIKSNYIVHLKNIFRHKNYLLVVLMQAIASFAWIIMTTVMLNYIEIVLNFGTIEYLIAALCLLFGVIGFLALWRMQIEKKGKKKTLLNVFLFALIFLPLSLLGLVPLTPPINIIFGIIFILGIAAIFAGWSLFPYIYYADLADEGEKATGELNAGIYIGFPSILLNIFQAFGTMLLGVIIGLPALGNVSYSLGYLIWGPICSIILIIAYIYTSKLVTLDF